MKRYFVTGTDTDVGKTVASAWLVQHLNADYWKPIQSGIDDGTDIERLQQLSGIDPNRCHAPEYTLTQPLSPHESAKRDGVTIAMERFQLPATPNNLIVEGAGGLLVPINDDAMVADLITQLAIPTILVVRSGLGTINHTLLSLQEIARREINLAGIIISGPLNPANREAIEFYGKQPIIAEIPQLTPITPKALAAIPAEITL